MVDEPDYIVEIDGEIIEGPRGDAKPDGKRIGKANSRARPYVSVLFECCNVYQRVYRNRDATAYEGHCPRCSRRARLRIGHGGTDCRFFVAK